MKKELNLSPGLSQIKESSLSYYPPIALPNTPKEQTIDALYLLTDCQMSHSPYACVIQEGKPVFITVEQILAHTVERTTALFEQELALEKHALQYPIYV